MLGSVAAVLVVIGIGGLFYLESRYPAKNSGALWIAIIYMLLVASRPLSVWLGLAPPASIEQALEGSPVDRITFGILQAMAAVVLIRRWDRVRRLLQGNTPLVVFLAYCLLSLAWSEYPWVAMKRWVKLVGEVMVIMVVLTDPVPAAAIRRFLVWPSFILAPVSVLFIKYYPELGRAYEIDGTMMFVGVTNNKNLLGALCLFWGLGLLWILLDSREGARAKAPTLAVLVALGTTLWLLKLSNSATSKSCFAIGAVLLIWAKMSVVNRTIGLLHLAPMLVSYITFAVLVLGQGGAILEALGRDPTLTGRTELWERILRMADNPLLGSGYESFWLGSRLEALWNVYWWRPTQAHNGFIEIYLNLGWIGIICLVVLILAGYSDSVGQVHGRSYIAVFSYAVIVVAVIYNYTEATFRIQNLCWIFLVWAVLALRSGAERGVQKVRLRAGRVNPWMQAWSAQPSAVGPSACVSRAGAGRGARL